MFDTYPTHSETEKKIVLAPWSMVAFGLTLVWGSWSQSTKMTLRNSKLKTWDESQKDKDKDDEKGHRILKT